MSNKLDLEFIEQPIFSLASANWRGVFVLSIGLSLATLCWITYQSELSAYEQLTAELAQKNRKTVPKVTPLQVLPTAVDGSELKLLKESVNKLTIPWELLLEQIEQSETKDIALLSLEPSTKKQLITLTGEGKDLPSVLAYIEQLELQPDLAEVYLQKHSIDEANPYKPVTFTIVGQWLAVQGK